MSLPSRQERQASPRGCSLLRELLQFGGACLLFGGMGLTVLLQGCASTPPRRVTPSASQPVIQPGRRLVVVCDDPYLSQAFERICPENSLQVCGGADPPDQDLDATVDVTYQVEFERRIHPMAWLNVCTLAVGTFFFYFRINAATTADVSLTIPDEAELECFSLSSQLSYKHPGYIPDPDEVDITTVLFYQDVLHAERQRIAAQVAREVLRRLSSGAQSTGRLSEPVGNDRATQ